MRKPFCSICILESWASAAFPGESQALKRLTPHHILVEGPRR